MVFGKIMFSSAVVLLAAQVGIAKCGGDLLGKITEFRGNWTDRNVMVGRGSEVCTDSRLERTGHREDTDWLSIKPLKEGSAVVRYLCNDGVTCVGTLNLARIPVTLANSSTVDDFLTFLARKSRDRDDDLRHLQDFIHRGRADLSNGIVLSNGGWVAVKSLLGERPVQAPLWLEFCAVRPGALCSDPARPLEWDGQAGTISLEPGFYKVVLDKKIDGEYYRTGQQSYILVVPDQQTFDVLTRRYAEAQRSASTNEAEEGRHRELITYLYYLGGVYRLGAGYGQAQ